MNEILVAVTEAWKAQSVLEIVAVFSSATYLILAAREVIWCWLFGAISTICYIIILWEVNLLAEMGLQFYYLFMAGYGYVQWRKRSGEEVEPPIVVHSLKKHVLYSGVIIGGTAVVGWSLNQFTDASMPYIDAFTTVGALFTTWMVTKKMLENWLYWIIVDGVGVYMYWQKEMYLTSLLFMFFVITVIVGFFKWRKLYANQLLANS
jgi:nicotinamide mononucleotide transporter